MPGFSAVLTDATFEARQFYSGVKPCSRQSSISATYPSVARPCRLMCIGRVYWELRILRTETSH